MSRRSTPQPESRFIGGGGVVAAAWSVFFVLLWLVFDMWWFIVFALPLVLYGLYLLQGFGLLVAAWWRWRGSSIRGILVFSDSPNWKPYIEEHWVPRLEGMVVPLNWSQRKAWPRSLPVRIFRRFGLSDDNSNFNPSLILFRGVRHPFVYRYFYAFRDAKHGRSEALRRLEEHMFGQFDG